MYTFLSKLTLLNFKNYGDATFDFSPKINCIAGDNGIGKTNIIDAIYYLSMCKSYFSGIDSHHIRHGEEFFVIQGEFLHEESHENIYCGVKSGQKKVFRRNGKEYDRLSDHIGLLPVVMISPSDSVLITEGSEERRKFLDSVISQFDRGYLNDVVKYNRAVTQRNLLLKEFDLKNWFDPDMVAIWDDQLINLGNSIFEKRKAFISSILPVFQQYYDYISGGNEVVELIYESQLFHNNLEVLLKESLPRDRKVLFTTCGVHKDDLLLKLGDFPIKRLGSQGQQKTYLVALKFAQYEFVKKSSGQYPLLLLDDVFDKFDAGRVNKIIDLVSDKEFGQIFITDTSYTRMEEILKQMNSEYRLFNVKTEGIEVESMPESH